MYLQFQGLLCLLGSGGVCNCGIPRRAVRPLFFWRWPGFSAYFIFLCYPKLSSKARRSALKKVLVGLPRTRGPPPPHGKPKKGGPAEQTGARRSPACERSERRGQGTDERTRDGMGQKNRRSSEERAAAADRGRTDGRDQRERPAGRPRKRGETARERSEQERRARRQARRPGCLFRGSVATAETLSFSGSAV